MGTPKKKNKNVVDIFTKKPIDADIKNSIFDEVKEALKETKGQSQGGEDTEKRKKKPRKTGSGSSGGSTTKKVVRNTININNNSGNVIGSADNAKFISKTTKVIMAPPPDTIGANDHMMRIFNAEVTDLADVLMKDWVKLRQIPKHKSR